MQSVGIVCEYNPFHNGHLYHLQKVKEIAKGSPIILVLGTSFTERGDISILNKWEKTKLALTYGVDLVVELPFPFATQSADFFAQGAIEILKHLQCEKIVFGTESNDISTFESLAETELSNKKFHLLVKEHLNKGKNYPTALSQALKEICHKTITDPNDLLALSYIKEIKKQKANITPISIQRTNSYHDTKIQEISSATAIRANLSQKRKIQKALPKETFDLLKKKERNYLDTYFQLLKFKILTEEENIQKYQTVEEGIEHKILKEIHTSETLEELMKRIKTKRYTYNKLKRMCLHILCSFTKEEAKQENHVKYLKVLGFSKKGRSYLNQIKKEVKIPIITKIKKKDQELLAIDKRVTNLYNFITNTNESENQIMKKESD